MSADGLASSASAKIPIEHHTKDAFAVQVAPHGDDRHAPPERPRRAACHRPLDEPRAGRNPCERDQVRAWNRARLENEEPQDEDCQRRQGARLHAAAEVDERQRRRDRHRLQHLDGGVTAEPPRSIRARLGEPGGVALPVVWIGEAEDVGANEAPGQVLAALRQMPPEIRFVDRAKADERGGRRDGQRHDKGFDEPGHGENISSKSAARAQRLESKTFESKFRRSLP